MSMIFQSYALWPHMTVAQNVAYGLELRKIDRATIAQQGRADPRHHAARRSSPTAIRASSRAASSSASRSRAR